MLLNICQWISLLHEVGVVKFSEALSNDEHSVVEKFDYVYRNMEKVGPFEASGWQEIFFLQELMLLLFCSSNCKTLSAAGVQPVPSNRSSFC